MWVEKVTINAKVKETLCDVILSNNSSYKKVKVGSVNVKGKFLEVFFSYPLYATSVDEVYIIHEETVIPEEIKFFYEYFGEKYKAWRYQRLDEKAMKIFEERDILDKLFENTVNPE